MYQLEFTPTALRHIKSRVRGDAQLVKRIEKALELLQANPNHVGLKTHKVSTKYGEHFSSRITGDLRIFWNYYQGKVIIILAVEDHSAY